MNRFLPVLLLLQASYCGICIGQVAQTPAAVPEPQRFHLSEADFAASALAYQPPEPLSDGELRAKVDQSMRIAQGSSLQKLFDNQDDLANKLTLSENQRLALNKQWSAFKSDISLLRAKTASDSPTSSQRAIESQVAELTSNLENEINQKILLPEQRAEWEELRYRSSIRSIDLLQLHPNDWGRALAYAMRLDRSARIEFEDRFLDILRKREKQLAKPYVFVRDKHFRQIKNEEQRAIIADFMDTLFDLDDNRFNAEKTSIVPNEKSSEPRLTQVEKKTVENLHKLIQESLDRTIISALASPSDFDRKLSISEEQRREIKSLNRKLEADKKAAGTRSDEFLQQVATTEYERSQRREELTLEFHSLEKKAFQDLCTKILVSEQVAEIKSFKFKMSVRPLIDRERDRKMWGDIVVREAELAAEIRDSVSKEILQILDERRESKNSDYKKAMEELCKTLTPKQRKAMQYAFGDDGSRLPKVPGSFVSRK